jgi:hypothetical protein
MSKSREGIGVTTIAEEVDEDLWYANLFGDLEKGDQMEDVGVLFCS